LSILGYSEPREKSKQDKLSKRGNERLRKENTNKQQQQQQAKTERKEQHHR